MNTLQTDFPDRLVTLSTGSPGLRGSIHVDILTPGTAPAPGAASGASPDAPIAPRARSLVLVIDAPFPAI